MDRIINYLLLIIIFVFDPLAISLVIAANFAFEKLKPKEKKLYTKKNWIDENQNTKTKEGNVVNKQKKEQPQKEEIKQNEGKIRELEKQIKKTQDSGLIEKRRNEEINKIQSQIDQLKKEDDDLTIIY